MVNRLWWSRSTILFIDCLPYEWQSGTSDGLFLPIYPPRSMRVMLWFLMTSKFLQQVHEFFWLILSPWIIRTLTLPPLLASLVPRTTFACIIHPPYTFLKTVTIPTYYGISIAILRYIAMQLSTVPFIMTRSIIVILLAWSCSWHRICGKATIHNFSYMSLLNHCTSRYTAEGIHIESYFVISIEL